MRKINNYAFIDGQNFFESTDRFHWEFDPEKFYNFLRKQDYINKIFYFLGYEERHKDNLYKELRKQGLTLCFKRKIRYKDKNGVWRSRANVDGKLIARLLIEINNFNKAVIVAGDGDYYFLIQYLIRQGKLGKIYMPSKNKGSSLIYNYHPAKPYILYISKHRELFEK